VGRIGGVRAADVRENVDDDSSEDVYAFYDAIGRRDAGDISPGSTALFGARDPPGNGRGEGRMPGP
jgi:hypothetical protein